MSSLSRIDALQRFSAERVAVLGTVAGTGSPHLVPVTFAVVGDAVAFAVDHKPKTTTRLRRTDNIRGNPRVGFLVDTYDDDWSRLWWVRVDAVAEVLQSGRLYELALDALAAKYQQYRDVRPHDAVVVAQISEVTGWAAQTSPTREA